MVALLSRAAAALLLPLFTFIIHSNALDNGFTTPALGWSSWYAAPHGSQVTDAFVRASAQALVKSGLAKKGYRYVNVDEGWLKGRSPNGSIYEDLEKFPQGMKGLGDWVRSQSVGAGSEEKLVYGLYSCRGTCQCGTGLYHAVGSNGHEAADTQWMIDAGARWLKIDSCCGSQNHSVAFSDYSKFRDAMNKSGEQVWFNLCGWRDWYASSRGSPGLTRVRMLILTLVSLLPRTGMQPRIRRSTSAAARRSAIPTESQAMAVAGGPSQRP
jgi:hypothetical protein